jgi:hypothetical protein
MICYAREHFYERPHLNLPQRGRLQQNQYFVVVVIIIYFVSFDPQIKFPNINDCYFNSDNLLILRSLKSSPLGKI